MIRFEVKMRGDWIPVIQGIILGDGKRLAFWNGAHYGIVALGGWRLSPATIANPAFKAALWDGLSDEEKLQAITRMTAHEKLAG